MPATLRTNGTSTSTTKTLTRPSAVLGGDVMVALINSRQTNSTPVVLSGWTIVGRMAPSNLAATSHIAMKVADGPIGGATTEPASFTPMDVAASNITALWTYEGDTVNKDPTTWVAQTGGGATQVTSHPMFGHGTAAGDGYVGIVSTHNASGAYTLPATAGTIRLGPIATATNSTGNEGYSVAWVPALDPTPNYLGTNNTALGFISLAVRIPQTSNTPTAAFPWKGLAPGRPWYGLGTDVFKGLAA